MDARTEADIELARIILVDDEPRYVISRSPAKSFHDLNCRRAAMGLAPVHPASTLALSAHEARASAAAQSAPGAAGTPFPSCQSATPGRDGDGGERQAG